MDNKFKPALNPEKSPNSNSSERLKEISNFLAGLPRETNRFEHKFSEQFWEKFRNKEIESHEGHTDKYAIDFREKFNYLKSKLQGQTVADLGSNLYFGDVAEPLENLGVKKYIAVDKYANIDPNYHGYHEGLKEETIPELQQKFDFDFRNEDMLSFVSKLPDNSTNFIVNGIDNSIIIYPDYWKYLLEEIHRALPPKGIITGTHGYTITEYADKKKFKVICDQKDREKISMIYILEKI